MQFDYDWDPGEHDSAARRWFRRVAFVVGLLVFVWGASIVTMGGR